MYPYEIYQTWNTIQYSALTTVRNVGRITYQPLWNLGFHQVHVKCSQQWTVRLWNLGLCQVHVNCPKNSVSKRQIETRGMNCRCSGIINNLPEVLVMSVMIVGQRTNNIWRMLCTETRDRKRGTNCGTKQNLERGGDQTQNPKWPVPSFTYERAHYNVLDYEEKIPSRTNWKASNNWARLPKLWKTEIL